MFKKIILLVLSANMCLSSALIAGTSYGSQSSAEEVAKMISQLDKDFIPDSPSYKHIALAGANLAVFSYIFKKIANSPEEFFIRTIDEPSAEMLRVIASEQKQAIAAEMNKIRKNHLQNIFEHIKAYLSGKDGRITFEKLKSERLASRAEIASIKSESSALRVAVLEEAAYRKLPTEFRIMRGTIFGTLIAAVGVHVYFIINETKKINAPINNIRVRIMRDMEYLLNNDPSALLLYVLSIENDAFRKIAYSIISENAEMNKLIKEQVLDAINNRNIEMTQAVMSAAAAVDAQKEQSRIENLKKDLKRSPEFVIRPAILDSIESGIHCFKYAD